MATELNLKATITTIAKFERDSGTSLMTAFSAENMGIATIVDLVQALSGASDDQIDEYVAEHGIEVLNGKLMQAFEKSGFLAKAKVAQVVPETPKP